MAKRRIFVSCGQETEKELQLGREIKAVIEEHDMEGFLAQAVHSPDELNTTVFTALRDCAGFCAIMHKRGEIKYLKYDPAQRSSVWIQQEIAVVMYRRFLQGRPIPIRVFSEKGILLEGVMKYSIANPIEFEEKEEVLKGISKWLGGPEFEGDPILDLRDSLFQKRIRDLLEEDWLLLKLIAVHTNTGVGADYEAVIVDFVAILKEAGKDGKELDQLKSGSLERLRRNFLIDQQIDQRSGKTRTIIFIQPKWWDLVLAEFRTTGRMV